MIFLKRVAQTWTAWRNLQMYRDMAVSAYIAHAMPEMWEALKKAEWWYERLQYLRHGGEPQP